MYPIFTALMLMLFGALHGATDIDSLKQLLQNPQATREERLSWMIDLGFSYWDVQADSASIYGQRVLELATELADKKGQMNGYNILGIAHWVKGEHAEAIAAYKKGLALAQQDTALAYAIPSFMTNIGICYKEVGAHHRALEQYLAALRLVRDNPVTYVNTLNNIGLVYEAINQPQKALAYFDSALVFSQSMQKYPEVVASIYNNKGNVYFRRKDWSAAKAHFDSAYTIGQRLGSISVQSDALNNLGVLARKNGDLEAAKSYVLASYQLARKNNHRESVITSLLQLSKIEQAEGQRWNAVYYADSALSMAKRHDFLALQAEGYKTLASYYEAFNYGMKALDFYKQYEALEDSLYNIEQAREMEAIAAQHALADMEEKHSFLKEKEAWQAQELQSKQRQNRLLILGLVLMSAMLIGGLYLLWRLRKSLRQQHAQRVRLEELNAIKDQMFSIVSHDFKGPLNSLRSILTLVEEGEISEEDLQHVIPALQKELNTTSQLVENLLFWARSQMEGMTVHPKVLDLKQMIEFDRHLLWPLAEKKNINLQIDLPQALPAYGDEDMVQLIIRNLMSNAIKFTPEGGLVKVNAFIEEEHWCIQVKDTGVGIPPEKKSRLFDMTQQYKTRGTDNEKGSGLGLKLCKVFVEKNNGWIWVSSTPGEGSTFSFTLPRRPPDY